MINPATRKGPKWILAFVLPLTAGSMTRQAIKFAKNKATSARSG